MSEFDEGFARQYGARRNLAAERRNTETQRAKAMTTQAQAPTDEMRKTASALWANPTLQAIAQALAAQDRLARAEERERCAKLADERAELHAAQSAAQARAGFYVVAAGREHMRIGAIEFAAFLRAQGEK